MNDNLFEDLLRSVQQMDDIVHGRRAPVRVFYVVESPATQTPLDNPEP